MDAFTTTRNDKIFYGEHSVISPHLTQLIAREDFYNKNLFRI
jgi:hypothetical protein